MNIAILALCLQLNGTIPGNPSEICASSKGIYVLQPGPTSDKSTLSRYANTGKYIESQGVSLRTYFSGVRANGQPLLSEYCSLKEPGANGLVEVIDQPYPGRTFFDNGYFFRFLGNALVCEKSNVFSVVKDVSVFDAICVDAASQKLFVLKSRQGVLSLSTYLRAGQTLASQKKLSISSKWKRGYLLNGSLVDLSRQYLLAAVSLTQNGKSYESSIVVIDKQSLKVRTALKINRNSDGDTAAVDSSPKYNQIAKISEDTIAFIDGEGVKIRKLGAWSSLKSL